MGITGLYAELGPGERVSLAKLAHDHYVANGRPLRVAVDVAIWSFQMQNAQGGSNPALRTLYYRLTRLLSHPILPIFVFDGPSRPAFKRNKQVASLPSYVTSAQKKLISLFGFPYHVAPGEAEAECANLQKAGVVDATLSEDVDTLMFGCGLVLRNWSGEGSAAIPTHITVYDLDKIRRERKLTPEGMIMIALMSGGDYIPAGVSGCGIRTAAEAAKAGFGKDLCRAAMDDDEEGLKDWRERLIIELRTNKSKLFKRKNNTIQIPHSFPDKQVMGYYLSPVVSPATADIIKNGPDWEGWVDIPGLRAFVREMFEWKCKGGAKKMIRTLAPGLLVSKLLRGKSARDEQVLTGLVKQIHTRRVHHSTDGLPELRTSFIPATVVPIDLELEPEDGLDDKADSDDEEGVSGSDSAGERSKGKRRPKNYDPFTVERVWITEQALRTGLPKRVEEWEEALNKPRRKEAAPRTKPGTAGKRGRGTGAEKQAGAIEKFLKVSKPAAAVAVQASSAAGKDERGDESLAFVDLSGEPSPPRPTVNAAKKPTATARAVSNPAPKKPPAPKGAAQSPAKAARKAAAHAPSPAKGANPWSLSKRPATAAAAGAKAQGKPAEHQRSRSEDISSTSPTPVKKSSTSRPLQHTRSSASVWRDPLRCLEGSSAVSKPNASSKTKPTSRPKSSPAPQGVKCSPPPAKPVKAGQPHAIDSTPDPLAPLALHGEKRHRKLHSPSPVCKPQVIELTSSPPAADSCPGTPNKESTTQANRISESPSKKQKTPESVRRSTIIDTNNNPLGISGSPLSTATVDRANSDNKFAFANNTVRTYSGEFIESLVYGDHLAFFEQEALVGLDVSKLSPATSYLPSYNKEDKNTSSRVTTIDKVNRILDFSSMPPHSPMMMPSHSQAHLYLFPSTNWDWD
ncbi:hypothetical protein BDZ91DRAFT_494701 [Kalaharituber pfeilii]|nr:hypothetical protein BDZ91DRAFT_494701 [Kalaharituber pfeilii]